MLVHAEGAEAAVEELVAFLREGRRAARVDERRGRAGEGRGPRAVRDPRRQRRRLRRPGARGDGAPLRPAPRGRRRDALVGGAEGAVAGPGGQAPRGRRSRTTRSPTTTSRARLGDGGVIVWDRGNYEQGGRVPWPEALERGHAVFVLHGEKLRGGFALQRTRPGAKPQWLLIKRRDDDARPGSDVVAEEPRSVRQRRHAGRAARSSTRAALRPEALVDQLEQQPGKPGEHRDQPDEVKARRLRR